MATKAEDDLVSKEIRIVLSDLKLLVGWGISVRQNFLGTTDGARIEFCVVSTHHFWKAEFVLIAQPAVTQEHYVGLVFINA